MGSHQRIIEIYTLRGRLAKGVEEKMSKESSRPETTAKHFALGTVLNTGYTIIELVLGAMVGSVALVADALHNLSDVVGLLLAWVAELLTRRHPTLRRTYGLKGTTIMAALINAVMLVVAMVLIVVEAVSKLQHPAPVAGWSVVLIAGAGVVVNGATALMFGRGHKDLNVRGAFLHMAADAGVSVAVVVAGIVMMVTGWRWVDPVASLIVAGAVLGLTWGLLRDATNMALAAVPRSVNAERVEEVIARCPSVVSYHDLHIWAISTSDTALTVHVRRNTHEHNDAFLDELAASIREQCGITHITIQVEYGNNDGDNAY
ncbi:Co Zn Cd efflux system component [Lacticaseibacillus pantheris DSM 15945 = JCM 12539 = NBRC 106106]|uniref:Co Zn Cd efflux system component n=2 Tax=Lacticaseibacillus pantheris TaxID=171523 RepID=A0A0R1TY10_9LACO|nr:Co Zn Cd efflux system component [Lacticaseibacillus pantheris DSM 15945 = JCM 12539 = NBRC 106106]